MADDGSEVRGYGEGNTDTVLSVDAIAQEAEALGDGVSPKSIRALTDGEVFLEISDLTAGYGRMEILHGIDLAVSKGQSLCLVGPNGAGKSTILHSIFGFTQIFGGTIFVGDKNVTRLSPSERLAEAGIAYILQDNSVFPDMTVEENLLMGGYLLPQQSQAHEAAEKIFSRYERLAKRRLDRAGVLSGGERRLLEISRALIMNPDVLLVDEPSIGLEPRYIDMVFEILNDLKRQDGKTIIMVEQNARKGLAFADLGYVLVSGRVAMADRGEALLENPDVGRLFLGG